MSTESPSLVWSILSVSLICGCGLPQVARCTGYPADAGVIDVTKPPYGAVGDGAADDTAAIQAALNAAAATNRIVYLPDGVYRVTDTLRWGSKGSGREQKRTVLEGQSASATIIRLDDRLSGFSEPASPKPGFPG